jgi:hypothetical protein
MIRQALTPATIVAAIAGAPLVANADLIGDRGTLEGLLGLYGTLEDFEAYNIGSGSANPLFDLDDVIINQLDSSSIANGQGPGLVKDGAIYSTAAGYGMQWNGDDYFGMESKTIGGNSGGLYTAVWYTQPVTAMGLDVQVFSGYGGAHQARVYNTSNDLIGIHDFVVDSGRYFFGWADAGGIGRVEIEFLVFSWGGMIDDHLYGVAVPAPGAIAMLGVAGLFGSRRRRAS